MSSLAILKSGYTNGGERVAEKYEEDTRYNIETGYIKSATQLHL